MNHAMCRGQRYALALCALVGVLTIYGCGSGSNYADVPNLRGSYVGTFVLVNGAAPEAGTMEVVIGPDNRMAGTVHNDTTGADGTITGEIGNGVALTADLMYPDGKHQLIGNIGFDTRDYLVGVLRHYLPNGTRAGTLSLDLAPVGVGNGT